MGAVPFEGPPAFRVEVGLPNRGAVTGMGIPEGVTLVVGGGFHGKSTLLSALSWGVYDHVPGDGREYVVARRDAVKVRAEDGRSVSGVDISAMIGDLPGGRSTEAFSTPNASGSTSQAANIAEALEIGTSLLLVDEDTSATNFMIRDERMRELVRREPITPFIDLVGPLHRSLGVSTVVVVGGVGGYLEVADRVILLEDYAASDATDRAHEVVGARVMALDDPTSKMSKSAPTPAGYVELLDEPDVIRRKIRRAKTDSGSEIFASPEKPAITNLLNIYAGLTDLSVPELEERYRGRGYGDLKKDLGEVVVESLTPIRERALELLDDPKELDELLESGAERARKVARATLRDAQTRMGLD